MRAAAKGFWQPKTEEYEFTQLAEVFKAATRSDRLLPVPLIAAPASTRSRSSRLRHRAKSKQLVWLFANEFLKAVNATYSGTCREPTSHRSAEGLTSEVRLAHGRVHCLALREAHRLRLARRGCDLTGVHALEELIHKTASLPYGVASKVPQEAMRAKDIDEPGKEDLVVVKMLEVMSAEEAAFYEKEENVIDYREKSKTLFDELQRYYGFIGGTEDQYAEYFCRQDICPTLWHFATVEEVKAIAGMSTVPKKAAGRQRKLIMLVAANYLWSDVRRREEHGLHGGGAISKAAVLSDAMAVSAFDESNAFASVEVPRWFWAWQSVPP